MPLKPPFVHLSRNSVFPIHLENAQVYLPSIPEICPFLQSLNLSLLSPFRHPEGAISGWKLVHPLFAACGMCFPVLQQLLEQTLHSQEPAPGRIHQEQPKPVTPSLHSLALTSLTQQLLRENVFAPTLKDLLPAPEFTPGVQELFPLHPPAC